MISNSMFDFAAIVVLKFAAIVCRVCIYRNGSEEILVGRKER